MGVVDTEGKKYLSDNEIFADAFNYLVYGGEPVIKAEDGSLKIKLTNEEFLSGLRKDDKLIPIVTAVVYLGDAPWDGPRSLHDMLEFKTEAIRNLVPDYKINLISPADMDDADFAKFNTDLGFAMEVIKHQSSDADEVIERTNHRKIDRDTALFLNSAIKLNLEYEEETGGVDMSLHSLRRRKRKMLHRIDDHKSG